MTLREALRQAVDRLAQFDDSRAQAEQLLLHVTGLNRTRLYSDPHMVVKPGAVEKLETLLQRRVAGEPLAHLLGQREFYGLSFQVTPDVLIPRPDTESLIDWALELIPTGEDWRITDLGTGSGCIGLTLAHERPRVTVLLTDASGAALDVARLNTDRLALQNASLQQSSWLQSVTGEFDLIVSNPPYINADSAYLEQGDLPHEPETALTPGKDGLAAIRAITTQAPAHLKPGGWLLLEHGFDQGEAVRGLLEKAGFLQVETRQDLTGNDRVSGGRLRD